MNKPSNLGGQDSFVPWLLGIVAVLVVGAIVGGVQLSSQVTRDVDIIKTKLDFISSSMNSNTDGIVATRAKITALEILAARISDNHNDLKSEIVTLRKKLDELEREQHNQ